MVDRVDDVSARRHLPNMTIRQQPWSGKARPQMPTLRDKIKKSAPPARAIRQHARPALRLDADMTCEAAFRTIARHCLRDLTASQPAACRGDAEALHDMRIALTRMRAAMSFFSPMAADAKQSRLQHDM